MVSPSSSSAQNAVVFVFYTLRQPVTWKYPAFPKGWVWTGAGTTNPIGGKPLAYEREEQFNGPRVSREKMREKLEEVFASLKARGILKKYKLRNAYRP